MNEEPLYPFGFGLSYTTFEYSDIQLSSVEMAKDDKVTVSVTVNNTGNSEGEEVVQLYISDLEASTRAPIQSLKGTKRIKPGNI